MVAILSVLAVSYPVLYSVYAGTGSGTNFSCPPFIPCDNAPAGSASCSGFCVVEIQSATFTPGVLNITEGTTVEWVNMDSQTHTSTTLNSTGWGSPLLPPGARYEYTFANVKPGIYFYQCSIHPFMLGEIEVVPAKAP